MIKMKTNFTEYCRIKKSVSSGIKHIDFDKAFETRYYSSDEIET